MTKLIGLLTSRWVERKTNRKKQARSSEGSFQTPTQSSHNPIE